MTVDEVNLLNKKAEKLKDGVYTFKGQRWDCKDNKFIAYVKHCGAVMQRLGSFDTQIGNFIDVPRYDWAKELKKWMQSQ